MGSRLNAPLGRAQQLLTLHRGTFPTYWGWSKAVGQQARQDGRLVAACGWAVNVGRGSNPRSVKNFPLQANGAEMLRLACCALAEGGVRLCAPVHDALLIEAPARDIDHAVASCQQAMRRASEVVLQGFPLRTECVITRSPDRYPVNAERRRLWDTVFGLLGEGASPGVARVR